MIHSGKYNEKIKYRMWLSKQGDARYLSHHDVSLVLQQAIRRTNLPVVMCGDYNPRLKISFYTSVPVGVASEREPVDIIFWNQADTNFLQKKLEKSLPPGMKLVSLERIDSQEKYSLQISYTIKVSYLISPQVILDLMNSSHLWVTRTRKNKTQQINIRPFIHNCTIETHRETSSPYLSEIFLTIRMTPQGGISIWEILKLLGISLDDTLSLDITRTAIHLIPISNNCTV